MLGKPDVGWVDIKIGEFLGRGSYLTDIPIDCLNSCVFALSHNAPISFYIDEEGSGFMVVSYYNCTYVLQKDEDSEQKELLFSSDIDFRELAVEILNDIDSNCEECIDWMAYDDEATNLDRSELIRAKMNQLKLLLNKVVK